MNDRAYCYQCEHGHQQSAPEPQTTCAGFTDGKPCEGELRQLSGPGMRRAKAGA